MKYITVGYIANTHGLRGEVKIKPQSDFIEDRFAKGSCLLLQDQETYKELYVSKAYVQKGMVIAKFEGYDRIEEVEVWKGMRLVIAKDHLPELDEDEIYYHDLMGLQVFDDVGNALGEVVEIVETGAHEIIRVKGEKEILIPYTKPFILDVYLRERKLIVKLLEGML